MDIAKIDEMKRKLDEEQPDVQVEYPEVWDHKVVDNVLIGTVKRLDYEVPVESQYRVTSSVCEIEKPEGDSRTVWMPEVLKREFKRKGIKEGDDVAIKALGIPMGKRYYAFRVVKGE